MSYINTRFLFFLLFSLMTLAVSIVETVSGSENLSLSTPRYGHASVNDGKRIYVLAGANESGFVSDIEIIDPKLQKKMILQRYLIPRRFFSAVWDGKDSIYIIGGESIINNKYNFELRVEIFNTKTGEVTLGKRLSAPTRINDAIYLDGRIYVFGRMRFSKNMHKEKSSSKVIMFDIAKGKWSRVASMPTQKTTKAVVKAGHIYVVGGYNGKSSLDVFEKYDPVNDKWKSLPSMPVKISAHSLTIVNEKLYVFGNYNNLKSTYSYDFLTQVWKKIDIGYRASRHNATTTLNGITYVTGGIISSKGPALDYIQTFRL